MAEKYTKEEFWKLYENLPQELKDTLFAEETGDNIYNICKRNGIEEDLGEIVDYVGCVLLGVLTPKDFQDALETELNLEEGVAKKVSQEINRFIFYPVKEGLFSFYEIEFAPGGRIIELTPERKKKKKIELAEKKPSTEDVYREPIE